MEPFPQGYLFPLPVCGLSSKDLRISQLVDFCPPNLKTRYAEQSAPGVWVLFCLFGVAHMGDDTAKATNPDKAEMFLSH